MKTIQLQCHNSASTIQSNPDLKMSHLKLMLAEHNKAKL